MKSRVGPPHCVQAGEGAGPCAANGSVQAAMRLRQDQRRVVVCILLWTPGSRGRLDEAGVAAASSHRGRLNQLSQSSVDGMSVACVVR
jgi:hypothetical protein